MKNIDLVIKKITNEIAEIVNRSNTNGVVVGLSGGVDSSTVAALCKKSSVKVYGIILPCDTTEDEISRAREVAKIFVDHCQEIDIKPAFEFFYKQFRKDTTKIEIPDGNTKARLRMVALYYMANINNLLVAGTGNKDEDMIGYFTKYGDGAADFFPISDLHKSEVYEIAKYLGVPESVIKAKPTAGLWVGQTDEEELGMTYSQIEWAIKLMRGYNPSDVLEIIDKGKNVEIDFTELISGLKRTTTDQKLIDDLVKAIKLRFDLLVEKIINLDSQQRELLIKIINRIIRNSHKIQYPPIIAVRDIIEKE